MSDRAREDSAVRGAAGRRVAEQGLRDAIRRGDLAPGQRLIEAELGALYGVTRGSVRSALDSLVAEGLAERIPNRGARVRSVSVAEAIRITECRAMLEALIARRAAELLTDARAARLREQRELLHTAVAAGELLKYSALIAELYELLRDYANQPVAVSLLERLQAQLVRHQFQLSLRPGRPRRSLAELDELVDAVLSREPDRAERAARRHFDSVVLELAETVPGRPGEEQS